MHEYVGMKQGKVKERRITSEYYCGRCGYPVSDHDSYCSECGGYLHDGYTEFPLTEQYEAWYKEAKHVSKEDLGDFIDKMMSEEHDYESYVHAIAACCVATMQACGTELTGYQASWIPLLFHLEVIGSGSISGIKILNYDDMLYPQNEDKFKVIISKKVMESLKEEAKRKLEEHADHMNRYVSPKVLKHWIKLATGEPPYGLEVEE